jgi:TolB-like protein/Flp pilus assembly protein TadD
MKSDLSKWLIAALGVVVVALMAFIAFRAPIKESAVVAATKSVAETASASKAPSPDPNSVAVLPFTNLSEDKANEYFSDGISEELLSVLQKIPGLRVAARLSAFSFKGKNTTAQEIGEKLGVANLVEGSVRKSGKSVRITVRLSRAATGEQIWSESYTRDLKNIFAVQTELAQTVVEQLRGQIGGTLNASAKAEIQAQVRAAGKGGTENAEAYQLYLQGIHFLNQFSRETAIRAAGFLERGVQRDPAFALAWAALSRAGSVRGGFAENKRDFDEGFTLARRAADRALALEPELPTAHLARMRVQMWYDFDWKGAAESLRRARKIAPTDADVLSAAADLAYTFDQRGKAVELAREAVSRDPVNAQMRIVLGVAYTSVGRFDEAVAEFRRVIELSPSTPWGYAAVGLIRLYQERFDEAVREAERESDEWTRLTVQAQALWALNRKPESDAALARLIAGSADTAAYQIAEVYAYRRENDRAFEWLDRAWRQRDPGIAWTRPDLSLARLHDDPRWPAFLRRVKLADEQLK